MEKGKNKNNLAFYRRRMDLSQKQIANLLGHEDTTTVSRFENGQLLPNLVTIYKLGAIYRVPTDFLYRRMYENLRLEIRAKEAVHRGSVQQGLLFEINPALMPNILNHVAQKQAQFRPQTVSEFVGLQLARKLNDLDRLHHYIHVVQGHSQQVVLEAFANAHVVAADKRMEQFAVELERLTYQDHDS